MQKLSLNTKRAIILAELMLIAILIQLVEGQMSIRFHDLGIAKDFALMSYALVMLMSWPIIEAEINHRYNTLYPIIKRG